MLYTASSTSNILDTLNVILGTLLFFVLLGWFDFAALAVDENDSGLSNGYASTFAALNNNSFTGNPPQLTFRADVSNV